jgi:Cu(I)/Ag(I) efflux system membrane fusion protein
MSDTTPTVPPPRRRFGVGSLLIVLVVGLVAGGSAGLFLQRPFRGHRHDAAQAESPVRYTCPMHPTIVMNHPGECPICGMSLIKVEEPSTGGKGEAPKAERKVAFFRSPMDPKQTSPTPRKDEMGMDYLPVYEDEVQSGAESVQGLAAVSIDPRRQQLIGLRTAEVTLGPVVASWRTVGKVAVDETQVHHVNIKVGGFVENVYADYIGKLVRRGQPLFSIYSPDLLSVQEEYLLALRTRQTLVAGGVAAGAGADDLDGLRGVHVAAEQQPGAHCLDVAQHGMAPKMPAVARNV